MRTTSEVAYARPMLALAPLLFVLTALPATTQEGFVTPAGPRPGDKPAQVTIDPQRMCPLIDGEPFFAIGCCEIPAECMKIAAEAGLNLTVRWGGPGGEWGRRLKKALAGGQDAGKDYVRQYLNAAQEAGLWAVEFPALFGYEDLWWDIPLQAFQGNFRRFIGDPLPFVVDSVKEHPALFCYLGVDEPSAVHYDLCREFTEAVHARDPSHPVYFNFCGGLPEWPDVYDVASLDWYPRTDQTPLVHVYDVALRNSQLAHKQQRPYWQIPLMEEGCVTYAPLGREAQRAQTYMALIGGANGIVWWVWTARHVDNWDMIRQLAAEMRALTPVLTEPPASTNVRWEQPGLRNTVQVRGIKHAGRAWLLAANACQTPAKVRFLLPTTLSDSVKVWFEDREVSATGRQFTDRFEGYGRHVYEVNAQWPEEAEIVLEVELEEAEVAAAEAHERQPLSPNLIHDPGFESDLYWTFEGGRDSIEQARGRFDEGSRHGGRRSASIERDRAESRSMWVGRYVELKPNTRYTFGGYARAEATGPALTTMHLEIDQCRDLMALATRVQVDDFAPWRQYSTVFSTRDTPVRVRPVCDVMHFGESLPAPAANGKAWFDDVFLVEAPPEFRNMIVNGGFEGPESLRGWPRWWGCRMSLTLPAHIGTPDAKWGLDETQAYEGRKSLRLVTPVTQEWGMIAPWPTAAGQGLVAGTRLGKGKSYVLSAYMKADPPNVLVMVLAPDYAKQLRVSGDWERYVIPITLDRDMDSPGIAFELRERGTLWIDAVQYEEGAEPTEYREWRE